MSDQGKFLVLGSSGLLGRHVRRLLGPERTVATYRAHPMAGGVFFDAAAMRLRDTLLRGPDTFRAAFVLYGITTLDACARDPAGTARVNVSSIKQAIDDLLEAGVKPIFASSDAVFDGTAGRRRESDPPHPVLTYGKQKFEVEEHLLRSQAPWVIARLSKLVSTTPEPRNLLNEWADQLERNEPIRCAADHIFSPADVEDAARALIRMAEGPMTGLFHVCGPAALRRLDLLNLLIEKIRLRREVRPLVSACRMSDFGFSEPRPLDASMRPDKLYAALGTPFRGMDAVCADFTASRYSADFANQVRPA